ncbi:MAG: hypothetical protein ABIG08_00505 [bacterium]
MFKKLREVIGEEEKTSLLTARTSNAWLCKAPMPTLFVDLDREMEVLTSPRERRQHFETASNWHQEQLEEWRKSVASDVGVASVEHPLEVVTGDVALILVIEGEQYLVSSYRDIPPQGWLIPGGCPRDLEELLNPKLVAVRECSEEVIIGDKGGRIYSFSSIISEELKASLSAWGLESTVLISVPSQEIKPARGDAENLVMGFNGREIETKGVNVTVDPEMASVSITLCYKVELPIALKDLRLFDGEVLRDGTLLNRPVRLTNRDGLMVAIFSRGQEILSADWLSEGERARAVIP